MTRTRSLSLAAASLAAVAAVTFGATQASAQPVITGGLVNVTVANNTVQVPIGVAANVVAQACGLNVGVLAAQLGQGETVTCTSATGPVTATPIAVAP